ncbi:DUF1295 domain-containing protein [Robbsia betulipollinis]|nr:DUF1295 domain-containing protein [Robbsia betulipollinis]
MALAWRVALRTGNAGWIDVFWTFGLGVIGVAAVGVLLSPWLPAASSFAPVAPRALLAAALLAAWSLRLGAHILGRTRRNDDDPRYAQLREEWGARYASRLFLFLQVQALAGVPLLLAVVVAAGRPGPFGDVQDGLALAVCLVAVAGEALSDRALRRFARAPHRREAVCETGPWRWSRHPNYFFEWLGWCAWPVLALHAGHPWGCITLLAPLLMYVLLVHVSGIPPLEAHMARSRGAAWRDYAARTPAFFPWPPRSARRPPA